MCVAGVCRRDIPRPATVFQLAMVEGDAAPAVAIAVVGAAGVFEAKTEGHRNDERHQSETEGQRKSQPSVYNLVSSLRSLWRDISDSANK